MGTMLCCESLSHLKKRIGLDETIYIKTNKQGCAQTTDLFFSLPC